LNDIAHSSEPKNRHCLERRWQSPTPAVSVAVQGKPHPPHRKDRWRPHQAPPLPPLQRPTAWRPRQQEATISPYGWTSCNLDDPTGTEAWDEAKPGQILISPRVLMAVAALWDPTTGKSQVELTEGAARALDLKLQILEVRSPHDLGNHVQAGGLVSYGPSLAELWRQTARIVANVLKGATPAD